MSDLEASGATEHRHPRYLAIWVALVTLLAVSVVAGFSGNRMLAAAAVFLIAAVKAGLVISYYMGLRFEPRWITVIIGGAFLCIFVLFVGLFFDIVRVYGG